MNILIVSATEMEIKPFLKEKIRPDILITGVGIASTVFHLTHKLSEKKYDIVIQAGIAGAYQGNLHLGETVLIKEDTFADAGIEEHGKFKTLFETGLQDKNETPYTDGWLVNNSSFLKKSNLPLARGITVSTVTDRILQNTLYKEKYAADVESMEGAAFHYVCLMHKINFLQLRSISNAVGERDKTKWQIKEAINNLCSELLKIIKDYQ
jgi:futalosine hydrolase